MTFVVLRCHRYDRRYPCNDHNSHNSHSNYGLVKIHVLIVAKERGANKCSLRSRLR